MKQLWLFGAAAGALCVSGTGIAGGLFNPPGANVSLYGSYLSQNDDDTGLNPDGFGGGAQLGLNITPHFFVGGMYQYNYLNQSNAPASSFGLGGGEISYGEKVEQARAGGGLRFHLPASPVDVFGKLEYVHYDYQTVHATVDGGALGNSDRVNDDGIGVHAGAQANLPGLAVYGSIGYLHLSQSEGPEFNVGLQVPLAPFTWAFVEYRYDDFRYIGYSDDNQSSDVKAGVRLAF